MKKLYTVLVSVAVALSASAFDFAPAETYALDFQKAVNNQKSVSVSFEKKVADMKKSAAVKKAPAKAPAVADIEGEYYWTGTTLLQNVGDIADYVYLITDEESGQLYCVFPLLSTTVPIPVTYDATEGSITFPAKYKFGSFDNDGKATDLIFDPGTVTFTNDGYIDKVGRNSIKAYYQDGQFVFDFDDLISFAAYQGIQRVGYYGAWLENEFGEAPTFTWNLLGVGSMVESICSPWFDEFTDVPFDVNIYELEELPGAYLVEDPWGTGANLLIDATDPGCCIIPETETGFSFEGDGAFSILSCSANYETRESFLSSANADRNIYLEDGVIILPPNACFGYFPETDPEHIYSLNTEYAKAGYIKLPTEDNGLVESISADNVNAPVEYFNLQGVKVANPAAGGLYIKRQGSSVAKVIVK